MTDYLFFALWAAALAVLFARLLLPVLCDDGPEPSDEEIERVLDEAKRRGYFR